MKERNLFLSLIAIIFIMLSILYTNIGYADESLITNNKYTNLPKTFSVEFKQFSNENIEIINSKEILLKNISLSYVGETKEIIVPIINNSCDLDAQIHLNVSNSNTEYFKVTVNTEKQVLNKNSDETFLEISVQLIKKPISSIESTEIAIDIIAEPSIEK